LGIICKEKKMNEIINSSHFLPELGIGFAYMGRQFLLKVGEDEYRTDLLFYHTRLKCCYHYTELADDIKTALPLTEELQNELLNFEREHGAR